MYRTFFAVVLLVGALLIGRAYIQAPAQAQNPGNAAGARPAILFAVPQSPGGGFVDLTYLRELHAKGFEVDTTNTLDDLTWERISRYNVLVLYASPGGYPFEGYVPTGKLSLTDFDALMDRYVEAGGGVLVLSSQANTHRELFSPEMMRRWGFRIAAETIREEDAAKRASLTQMPAPVAHADQVAATPVSEGVRGLWYPTQDRGSPNWSAMTAPISVSQEWQVVVRASASARTQPIDFKTATHPLPDPFFHNPPIQAPPLFAIRQKGQGRIALTAQYPQFSVGSGTRWLYNREVLERGVAGKPSDFGRLLENTYRWLAAPSLAEGAAGGGAARQVSLGGFKTQPQKLVHPNYRPDAKAGVDNDFGRPWPDTGALAQQVILARQVAARRTVRGLIGAQTPYGDGQSSVAEYAAAAKKQNLDFVVFLDDYTRLTAAEFEALKADCVKYSDAELKLFGGFTIGTNTGNSLFMFGPNLTLPPAPTLTGPDKSLFALQVLKDGDIPALGWMLKMAAESGNNNQIGYYNINAGASRGGMDLPNLKMYGMAAVRYYKDGKPVEDVTAKYLTSALSTIPPAPVAFNEVASVAGLEREVRSGHALTYARVTALENLYGEALRYSHQYDSLPIFASDGPIIEEWPQTQRVATYGGQEFVLSRMLMPSAIALRSSVGLKEARIYNGDQLFRRFALNGAKEWRQVLMLEAVIHKNLVLVAEDIQGKKAVSYARRCWKDGSGVSIVFCSDRVNDCKSPNFGPVLLSHGPYQLPVTNTAMVPDPGFTWDGGPPAARPLAPFSLSAPLLESDAGREHGAHFEQTPRLEFTDEGGAAVSSERTRVMDARIPNFNPWWAWGPTAPSRLMSYTSRFRQWIPPTTGPVYDSWPGFGQRSGVIAAMHRSEITFKAAQTIKKLTLLSNSTQPFASAFVVLGRQGAAPQTVEATKLEGQATYKIESGGWFGAYTPEMGNSHLFVNRGAPLLLNVNNPRNGNIWMEIVADMAGRQVKAGEKYTLELMSVNYPLESAAKSAADLAKMHAYLSRPTGLKLVRGTGAPRAGVLELQGAEGAVEFVLPRPSGLPRLTLPVRVGAMNPRWSAWRWQKRGYEKGDYGNGQNRFSPLGVDAYNFAYIPAYTTWADQTHVVAGHPVVADAVGKELFIQVTPIGEAPLRWHVSVNNPTAKIITATLRRVINLPGLSFTSRKVTLGPGQYLVLAGGEKVPTPRVIPAQAAPALPAPLTGRNLLPGGDFETGIEEWVATAQVKEGEADKNERRPDWLKWEPKGDEKGKGALRVNIVTDERMKEARVHASGAVARLPGMIPANEDALVTFKARWLGSAKTLRINRLFGGSTSEPVQLSEKWQTFQVVVRSALELPEFSFATLLPANAGDQYAPLEPGSFLLDDVRIVAIAEAAPAPPAVARLAKGDCCGTGSRPAKTQEEIDMKLSPQQLEQYHEDGFTIVRDFFTPAQLQPTMDWVNEMVDALAEHLYEAGKIHDKHEGVRWQRPHQVSGFEGIKDPILMRSGKDPDYRVDWTQWATQNRIAAAMEEHKDEFDASLMGPWLHRWAEVAA